MTPSIRCAFTPTGKLRACINLGTPIFAGLDAAGKSVDVAAALQRHGIERASVAPAA